jgi:hypothetical protein
LLEGNFIGALWDPLYGNNPLPERRLSSGRLSGLRSLQLRGLCNLNGGRRLNHLRVLPILRSFWRGPEPATVTANAVRFPYRRNLKLLLCTPKRCPRKTLSFSSRL